MVWELPVIGVAGFLLGLGVMWMWMARRIHGGEKENALLRQQIELTGQSEERWKEQQSALMDQLRLFSSQALKENTRELKEMNQESMGVIVNPVRSLLKDLMDEMKNANNLNIQNTASLKGQIEEMMKQTTRIGNDAVELAKALKGDSKKRGDWGELVLSTILESSGLREGEQYELQPSFPTEEGKLRPDAIIMFPENRKLIIDSKVSLVDYDRYMRAEDEETRQKALKAHKESMRSHMKSLTGKAYPRLLGEGALDYVIMFVPIEAAYLAAFHDGSNDILLEGCKNQVLIVSPTNLIMTLKLALHLWKQQQQADNVKKIVRAATNIYEKCVPLYKHFKDLQNNLEKASSSFIDLQKAFSSGKGSLMQKVEELKKQGGLQPKNELPEMEEDNFTPGEYLSPDA